MIIEFSAGAKSYKADLSQGTDISIPLIFNGPQPNTYGVPSASAFAYGDGTFIGDTRQGGSCNFESYTLVPHCNGTHTECIGHITHKRIPVTEILQEPLCIAVLISITPESGADTQETYTPALNPKDEVITRKSLEAAFRLHSPHSAEAVIIRTLPNSANKTSRDYMQSAPVFFTHEAMQLLASMQCKHILTDFPSLDRLFDEGLLSNHRIWWNHPAGANEDTPHLSPRTITEMIFVPDHVQDGNYLLNLQIAPFVADASPSRPFVFPFI